MCFSAKQKVAKKIVKTSNKYASLSSDSPDMNEVDGEIIESATSDEAMPPLSNKRSKNTANAPRKKAFKK